MFYLKRKLELVFNYNTNRIIIYDGLEPSLFVRQQCKFFGIKFPNPFTYFGFVSLIFKFKSSFNYLKIKQLHRN